MYCINAFINTYKNKYIIFNKYNNALQNIINNIYKLNINNALFNGTYIDYKCANTAS